MTPDEHPTLEEWIAATQACCGVDHPDDAEIEVPKKDDAVEVIQDGDGTAAPSVT